MRKKNTFIHIKCSHCHATYFEIPYYIRFCKKCSNILLSNYHSLFNKDMINNGLNCFIPDNVTPKQYTLYYKKALTKFVKYVTIPSSIIDIVVSYLNYHHNVGTKLEYKDENGNYNLCKIKRIDKLSHKIYIKFDGFSDKWNIWIDSRNKFIDHPFIHCLPSVRDDSFI